MKDDNKKGIVFLDANNVSPVVTAVAILFFCVKLKPFELIQEIKGECFMRTLGPSPP